MSKKIVSNNLKKILRKQKRTAIWLRSELERIEYPITKNRLVNLMQNRQEIYFYEAIFISEVLGLKNYNDLVNGKINELIDPKK